MLLYARLAWRITAQICYNLSQMNTLVSDKAVGLDKKHILLVEDEASIRGMLRMALETAGFQVSEADDVSVAERLLADRFPDIILLDWMLPATSGIEFTRKLKKSRLTQNIPIIMLTAKAEEDSKVKGLESGVDDYVIKPFSPRELIARIRAVLRRGPLELPDGTRTMGELVLNTDSQRVTIAGENIPLGPLEYRLLAFFIGHQDRVYSRDELLTQVWGGDAYIDERTVDVHIRRLRKRIEAKNYDRYIQTIHGVGYRFSEKVTD